MLERHVSSSHNIKPISQVDVLFLAGTLLFLYTQLFQLPFTPYYFDGDLMISISNAMRLLNGEVIYRDFFHMTSPGAEVIYAALFAVFGVKVWVVNLVVLILAFAIAFLTWHISRHVLSRIFVYLPSTLLMVIGFRPFFNDGSYRLFSIVFVLAAVAALIKERTTRNLLIAGSFCGLASFFVQPRGVLAFGGILIFIVWESFRNGFNIRVVSRNAALLFASFVIVIAVTNANFIWQAGFDNYYFSLVTFVQNNYQHDPLSNSLAFFADIPELGRYLEIFTPVTAFSRFFRIAAPLLFFYFIPIVYLVFLFLYFRKRGMFDSYSIESGLMLLCCVGLALIAGISAPSGFRFAHASMPGIVVAVWLLERLRYSRILGALLLSALVLLGASYGFQRQTVDKDYLDMPAGRSGFLSRLMFEKYKWIGENTEPGEIFYEPYHPGFYFPFHLVNPTPMYLIRDSDYSPKFQIDAVVAALKKNPPHMIVWPRKWTKKAEERSPDDHLEPLWQFLVTNYDPKVEFLKPPDDNPYTVGDIEIWVRKE